MKINEFRIRLNRRVRNQQGLITFIAALLIAAMLVFGCSMYAKYKTLEKEHTELRIDYNAFKVTTNVKFVEAYDIYEVEIAKNEVLTAKLDSVNNLYKASESIKSKVLTPSFMVVIGGYKAIDINKLQKYLKKNKAAYSMNRTLYRNASFTTNKKYFMFKY